MGRHAVMALPPFIDSEGRIQTASVYEVPIQALEIAGIIVGKFVGHERTPGGTLGVGQPSSLNRVTTHHLTQWKTLSKSSNLLGTDI